MGLRGWARGPSAVLARLLLWALSCRMASSVCFRALPLVVLREGEVAEIKRLEGHLVDALAPRGDEGRGTLR